MSKEKSKHIIFLGAGASASSGYPLANRLVLLMSDRKTFFNEVNRCQKECGDPELDGPEKSVISQYLNAFQEAVKNLRLGAFASVDELSRLSVGSNHASSVRSLKKLLRYVFALYNPHQNSLAETDYRPFIYALFGTSSRIRDDTAIISFNYDPYFEFSLRQAFWVRQNINPNDRERHSVLTQAITSGFEKPSDLSWLKHNGFCHLKLHGVCVVPADPKHERTKLSIDDNIPFNANDFFTFDSLLLKLVWFAQQPHFNRDSPIIFPWEIIHESGRLLTREEFLQAVGNDWEYTNLYDLFVGLWQKAKDEVSTGSKFSFVGLSMSSFLEPAFRYLFSDLKSRAQFVVVNPENKRFENHNSQLHPRSPRGKTFAMLNKFVGKDFRFIKSTPGIITTQQLEENELITQFNQPEITAYSSFADFIYWELGS